MVYHVNHILDMLEKTGFNDVRWYIKYARWACSLYPKICRELEPRKNEVFRCRLGRIDDRDGWSISTYYTVDGIDHFDRNWIYRVLYIYLEWVRNKPPQNVIASTPVFGIPIKIFENIFIRTRDTSIQLMQPHKDSISIVFPCNTLEVSVKEYRIPVTEEEDEVTYDLEIECVSGGGHG